MNSRPDFARRREALYERIREAAIAEFAEHGLRGTTTQAIADRAGLTKTKLHYYISGKEELYQDVIDQIIGIWADLFDGIAVSRDPETVLRAYIVRKVRFSLEHPNKVKLFTNEVMRDAGMLQDHWLRSRADVRRSASLIESWVAEGVVRPVDPFLLLFHIWAMTEYYAVMAKQIRFFLDLGESDTVKAEHVASEIADMVLNGLLVAEADGRPAPRLNESGVRVMRGKTSR
ncbi:MAG: TetR family transcriptional regulator C-terminal domain-containing protein [Rhodobacter sp.]|nr:TetR family transcriptional regulator C-terminal domain-containing protein [Rhodobacter sp.]